MSFKNKISFHNRFDIIVKDAATDEIKQEAEALNIVTDYGIKQLLTFDDYWFKRIAIGRGTGTALSDDTQLFDQIGYKNATDHDATKAIPTSSWTRKITIGTTEYNGEAITEVGIGRDGYLFSKALIKDEQGNPITINKTDLDIIEIYATVYLTLETDTPGLYWHDADTNYLIDLFTEYETSVADSLEDVDTLEARYDGTLIGSIDGDYAYSVPDRKLTIDGRFDVDDANGTINELGLKNIFKFNLPEKEATPGLEIIKDTSNVIDVTAEIILDTPENRIPLHLYIGERDNIRKRNANNISVWSFTGHSSDVKAIAVDSEGYVYSGSADDTLRKINPHGNQVWAFTGHSNDVCGLAVDSNGNIYSGSYDDTVKKIDPDGNEVWSFTGHSNNVLAIAVDSEGYVYSGSDDATVKKIDPDGNEVWSFTGHSNTVETIAVDSEGYVYSGSYDDTVRKIDPDGNQVWAFTGHNAYVLTVAVDSNGNVYSGGYDDTVRKIDPDGNQVWSFTGHNGNVEAVVVDSEGYVYSGSHDSTVKKIDPDGNQVWSVGASDIVFSLAIRDLRV